MDFKELKLEHKQIFDTYFRSYDPQVCELDFTNLFMWRSYNRYRFIECKGFLCIVAYPEDAKAYAFFPIPSDDALLNGDAKAALKPAIRAITSHFREIGRCVSFSRMTERECVILSSAYEKPIEIVPDKGNSDYLYRRSDLALLSGKGYDGKRNHVARFKKEHSYEYVRIGDDNLDECSRFLEKWCRMRRCRDSRELALEKHAINELLWNYSSLGCSGAAVKADGNYEAFTIGNMLNWNTAVIHVEKANTKFNGIYSFINQEFCLNEWQQAVYINREQDMGVEGIRRAKMSYKPITLLKKYSAYI